MSTSLSSLVYNLSEGLYNNKCEYCKSYLDHMSFRNDQLIFRCFDCKQIYKKDFNKDLIKRFANIMNFVIKKVVYPYEYMESWK